MAESWEHELELLRARALEARKKDFPGRPVEEVLAEMEAEDEVGADEAFALELQRRAEDAAHNPQGGMSWADVKTQLSGKQGEHEQRS